MVVQFLYTDENFDSPFLLTYIGTTLFMVFLPSRLVWERRRRCCSSTSSGIDTDVEVIPWTNDDSYEHIPAQSATPEGGFTIEPESRTKVKLLSHRQHLCIAMKIAPVWFISNFAYNASLKYTSITSSTVLASTGSLFTFMFAIFSRDEVFSLVGFTGVMFGVVGSVLTGWSDVGSNNKNTPSANATFVDGEYAGGNPFEGHAMMGDFFGLLSAVGYGTYTVMIRVLCPHDESSYSMQLLLGYIGLVNGLSLLPVTIYLMLFCSTSTTMANLTWVVLGYLVAKGMLDNVLSDYLWARAVILTSATVATVGLGLTIPLAFFSDWFMGHDVANVQALCGALFVLIGFALVNVGFSGEDRLEVSEDESCDVSHLDAALEIEAPA